MYFFKRFRSFFVKNLESVGQRAAKLLVVKFGGLKKKSAFQPRPHSNQSACAREHLGSNHSKTLMAGNFVAHWPTDHKLSAFKDLNLLKKHIKNQEATNILGGFLPSQSDLIYVRKCTNKLFAMLSIVKLFLSWLKIAYILLKFFTKFLKFWASTLELLKKWSCSAPLHPR